MARMLRNVRGVKPNVETNDLKKFVRRFCFVYSSHCKADVARSLFKRYWIKLTFLHSLTTFNRSLRITTMLYGCIHYPHV